MIEDKSILKKIKLQRVLSIVQLISTSSVVVVVILALIINGEPTFKGKFAFMYSIVLAVISAMTIVVTIIKSKLEANILDCMNRNIYNESKKIHDILTGKID